MLAFATDVELNFETPEIGAVAVPMLVVLGLIAGWFYVRSGRRPQSRIGRLGLCGLAVILAVSATVLAGRSGPSIQRGLVLAMVAILFLGLAPTAYARTTVSIAGPARWALLGLRLIALVLVLLLLSRPVVRRTAVRVQRPTLAVLLDDSGSMQIRDMPKLDADTRLISRAAAVSEILDDQWDRFERLAGAFDIECIRFSDAVAPAATMAESPWPLEAAGALTDLAAALSHIAEESEASESPVGAVLLISDGSNNVAPTAEVLAAGRALAAREIPIFAAGVGSAEPVGDSRSLAAIDLRAPQRVTLESAVPISADFEAVGFAGTPIVIKTTWGDRKIDSRVIRPDSARQIIRVELEHVADEPGFHAIEVTATPRDRQWKEGPASLSQFVMCRQHAGCGYG